MYAYIHEKCGKPSFLVAKKPFELSRIDYSSLLNLDGTQLDPKRLRICQSCNGYVGDFLNSAYVQEIPE